MFNLTQASKLADDMLDTLQESSGRWSEDRSNIVAQDEGRSATGFPLHDGVIFRKSLGVPDAWSSLAISRGEMVLCDAIACEGLARASKEKELDSDHTVLIGAEKNWPSLPKIEVKTSSLQHVRKDVILCAKEQLADIVKTIRNFTFRAVPRNDSDRIAPEGRMGGRLGIELELEYFLEIGLAMSLQVIAEERGVIDQIVEVEDLDKRSEAISDSVTELLKGILNTLGEDEFEARQLKSELEETTGIEFGDRPGDEVFQGYRNATGSEYFAPRAINKLRIQGQSGLQLINEVLETELEI